MRTNIINEKLKECRLAAGKTLLEAADYIGVKEATIQRYESGKIKTIEYEVICSLAKLYDTTPQYLMGFEEPENIAAHHGGLEEIEDWTEEEKREIEQFKAYVRSKRG